jgi:hypothetical protein
MQRCDDDAGEPPLPTHTHHAAARMLLMWQMQRKRKGLTSPRHVRLHLQSKT